MTDYSGNVIRGRQQLLPIGRDLPKCSWPLTLCKTRSQWALGTHLIAKKAPPDSQPLIDTGALRIELMRKRSGWHQYQLFALKTLDQDYNWTWSPFFSFFPLPLASAGNDKGPLSVLSVPPSPSLSVRVCGGSNVLDCRIHHQWFWSIPNFRNSLLLPVTNFSSIPNVTINDHPPLEDSYQVQLLWSEHSVPCFHFSLTVTVLARLDTDTYISLSTFAPPHSHEYLNQICPQSRKELTNTICLCKVFRTTISGSENHFLNALTSGSNKQM